MKLRTQSLFSHAIILMIMVLLALVVFWITITLQRTGDKVEHSYKVIVIAHLIQKLVVDMETGKRGFLLTGKPGFLQPYEAAQTGYESATADLKDLLIDSPEQLVRLTKVEQAVDRWRGESAIPEIQMRQDVNNGRGGADMALLVSLVEQGTGDRLVTLIRDRIEQLIETEEGALKAYNQAANGAAARNILVVFMGTLLAIGLGLMTALFSARSTMRLVGGEPSHIKRITEAIAQGNLDLDPGVRAGQATGILRSVMTLLESLKKNREANDRQNWLKTGIAQLNVILRGETDPAALASKVITEICSYINAPVGAFYLFKNGDRSVLNLMGSYAYTMRNNFSNAFGLGEGLVGQAALERQRILVRNVPADYIRIMSGLGETVPRFICVIPFSYEDMLKGVIEIGTIHELTETELDYLDQAMPALAVTVERAERRTILARSLETSQRLSSELQTQQDALASTNEELQAANQELEEQAQRLEESTERLQVQQEEVQVINEELEEKNRLMERQTRQVQQARQDLQQQADELAMASKYKSEFLANMSHELRSPLNSLLLLAQGLIENQENNLTEEQMASAEIIHDSGRDLLSLIDEILDLSKIEAGRMEVRPDTVFIQDLADSTRNYLGHVAEEKGLAFQVIIGENAPEKMVSDRKRIEQIIRNLGANAVKFTEKGRVTIEFSRPEPGIEHGKTGLTADNALALIVSDTGIGIAPDKHGIIFEAFQQADGGTSRKYGGTGLGLSISRELAGLLGGEIQMESEPGRGSTFTVYLPIHGDFKETSGQKTHPESPSPPRLSGNRERPKKEPVQVPDDRDRLERDDRVILVIEDDPNFARILYKKCRERGFKCLAAPTGELGLEMAAEHLPGGIILDIKLPGMDGYAVLNALKEDIRTRHIPVHMASVEGDSIEARRMGALGLATKPLDLRDIQEIFNKFEYIFNGSTRRVLVVEDDSDVRRRTVKLIEGSDVAPTEVQSGAEAVRALRSGHFDCVILDLGLPDMSGHDVLDQLHREGIELPPVIVHTAQGMTRDEETALREHADSIIIKDARSQERLLDEVSLFLHRIVNHMPDNKRQIIRDLHDVEQSLRDRKVLIVDDDMRTTFAMSRLLAERGMNAFKADNGERALRILEQENDIEIVLMDIMMPGLDGYETMKRIRSREQFANLPIIALTAKAMPEDREKCMAAGASDYLPKPVDPGRLFSMMRVWLSR